MAPKRMPKVTSLSSSSTSSTSTSAPSSRGRNANPFGPVDPNSYDDYDEAMQDGVELEEKGERFQFGLKAQRFYVQAGTLYSRAGHLAGRNVERRADALYNASRVHFLLASQFALPPENLQIFVEAITTAQEAVRLAPPLVPAGSSKGALPNPFTLDTMTHLATSMQTLAEAVDELGWPQGLQPPPLSLDGSGHGPTPILLWQAAVGLFQQVADGQDTIIQDQMIEEDAVEAPSEGSGEPTNDATLDDSELASADEGGDVFGYTSSLVTPASLMETLLSLLACFTSLVEASSTIEEIQNYSAAVERIVAKAQNLVSESEAAATLPAISNNAAQASSEMAARWEEVQRSSLALRVACLGKSIDFGSGAAHIRADVEAAMQTVNDWASRLAAPAGGSEALRGRKDADVAQLCDVAEAGQSLCKLSLRLEPAQAGVASIWVLATASTKLFSQALAALDTSAAGGGTAAVLGQANTSTPTSRARCRILLALSSLSIFRSHPVFEAAGIAGAKGTRTKLIDNARLYARKAVTEIGLVWILRPPPAQAQTSAMLPPPGGWESLSLESEAAFHLLRALLIRANVHVPGAADANAATEMESELNNLAQHVVRLRQRPVQVGATPASASIQLAEWLYTQGVKSFVDGIVDENGRNIVHDEIAWWEKLFSIQLAK
ncbi:uncharacterized protein UTRI_01577_B [Ustilago trichophora]|uniref:Uncharacterized protein n=1 Tax=Ustilago trichophora TaxID=86804 RepID=A0A5C3E4N1_9BASI|nr:uncharacterized protein UTRI_01577_B [Ustilago trichophora]